ncbi:MAG: L-histidine N(alpha)-methyltransferase [Candidatus Dadabacteria bacterium]|nr:L-histidine N(alpha)-methyltransferase [Candidatus Dadabacteria bacterium]
MSNLRPKHNSEGSVHSPEQESYLREVLSGLKKPQKTLPCKLFYDEEGSALFDQICDLEEYYLTRTEIGIIENNLDEISSLIGQDCLLIEFGSGSSLKIRLLLDRLKNISAYVPIDISLNHLIKSTEALSIDYESLKIRPVCADYSQPFELPPLDVTWSKKVVFYPGSTIGNFTPEQALKFLGRIAGLVGKDGSLLIGVDLKKDTETLEAAYNDKDGLTSEFNLNILRRLNRELGANFQISLWKHQAFYNKEHGRVEMHLVSLKDQSVKMNNNKIFFKTDEDILTEYSYKYGIEEFEEMVSPIFDVQHVWTDKEKKFSVQYLTVK